MADSTNDKKQSDKKQKPRKQQNYPNHVFHKRKPSKPETGENVIYVSTKTSTKALLEKCTKLINNNVNEIVIYSLGAAIQRGILLALQLCEKHIAYQYHANTFTTTLIDDLEPAADEADYEVQKRFNSALRIKVFRTEPLEATSE